MFDYTDPYEEARQARESIPPPGTSPWPQNGQPWIQEPPAASQAPAGPLGDFGQSYNAVMAGAAPRGIRRESMAESAAKGAAVGLGAWLLWRGMRSRKARVGEWTTVTFRATMFWFVVFVLVLGAYAATDSLWVLLGGLVLDTVVMCWYSRRARHRSF